MIAAYNAGEGAVLKWLKDHPGAEVDLFVEEIPYKQTRGYTKRVLSSLAVYTLLYGSDRKLMPLDLALPACGHRAVENSRQPNETIATRSVIWKKEKPGREGTALAYKGGTDAAV